MSTELVTASAVSVPATGAGATLPDLVERAGGAVRFAWEEYFYAEHHNPHTQKAYLRAVKAFLGWAEGQGLRTSLGYLSVLGKSISPRSYSPAGRETDVFCTIDRQDNSIFSGTSTP